MKDLEEKLKQWIKINEVIDAKNNEIKELRQIKNNLNESLLSIIEDNNLQKSTFKINDNHIRYTTNKQTSPITIKYLQSCLTDLLDDESKVNEFMDYIKSNRETKIVNDIKNNKK